MFCPKCKAEYGRGIYRCPECDVDLIDALPSEPEKKILDFETEEVFATFNISDVVFIKSILDAEQIDYYFKGESSLYMVKPLVGQVKLIVKKQDAEKVKELLKELKENE